MAKIKIDRDGCISCGACWGACPEIYEQNAEDEKCRAEKFSNQLALNFIRVFENSPTFDSYSVAEEENIDEDFSQISIFRPPSFSNSIEISLRTKLEFTVLDKNVF